MPKPRAGFTLAETLVAMLIGSMVLAMLATMSGRQQRLYRELALAMGRAEQLQQTADLLPVELRSVAPGEGDILPGGATDTSIQFRALITTAIVCDTAGHSISLAPAITTTTSVPALLSVLMSAAAGDTVWALALSDTGESWTAYAITSVGTDHGGCLIAGVDALGGAGSLSRSVVQVAAQPSVPALAPGTPVRITRPRRYSLYKSSDDKWYLGDREWNPASVVFDAIQPVSGPFLPPKQSGLAFRFVDTLGGVMNSGGTGTSQIGLIQVALRSDSDAFNVGRVILSGEWYTLMSIGLRNRIR